MRPSDNPWQGGQPVAALVAALVRACLGSHVRACQGDLMDLVLCGVKCVSPPLSRPAQKPLSSVFWPRLTPPGGHPPPTFVR